MYVPFSPQAIAKLMSWSNNEEQAHVAAVDLWGINNYTHFNVWAEIIYLFQNFHTASVEVWEWISNSSHT